MPGMRLDRRTSNAYIQMEKELAKINGDKNNDMIMIIGYTEHCHEENIY